MGWDFGPAQSGGWDFGPAQGEIAPAATTLTFTVGAGAGRDYASVNLAVADISVQVSNLDMTLSGGDEAVIIEVYRDGADDTTRVTIDEGLTCDPVHNVTIRAAAGEATNGVYADGGVTIEPTSGSGHCFTVVDHFVVFEGLNVGQYSGTAQISDECFRIGDATHTSKGTIIRNCRLQGKAALGQGDAVYGGNYDVGIATYPIVVENCVLTGFARVAIHGQIYNGTNSTHYWRVVNCTFFENDRHVGYDVNDVTDEVNFEIVNCFAANAVGGNFGASTSGSGTVITTGSTNNHSDRGTVGEDWPDNPTVDYQNTTNTSPGAGTWAIWTAEGGAEQADFNGLWQNAPGTPASTTAGDGQYNDVIGLGVGPDSNALVPTTDILGNPRVGTVTDPGAFMSPLRVELRTLGTASRAYSTFTLAEADVPDLCATGGNTDLVGRNCSVVFEAYADSVFSGSLSISGALTTDPTRNVTYRAASGEGHDGTWGSGVELNPNNWFGFHIHDDHTVVESLSFGDSSHTTGISLLMIYESNVVGVVIRQCLFHKYASGNGDRGIGWLFTATGIGSTAYPTLIENCAFVGHLEIGLNFTSNTGCVTHVVNCSFESSSLHITTPSTASPSNTLVLVNCLGLNSPLSGDFSTGAGTVTTGSTNNFSSATLAEFPGSDGTQYTVTTSLTPGVGDWIIIADDDTTSDYLNFNAALVDSRFNDVLRGGVGPELNTLVSDIDILGIPREGPTTDPGAFTLERYLSTPEVGAAQFGGRNIGSSQGYGINAAPVDAGTTGTSAVTIGAATTASSGDVSVSGTSAITLASATTAASGTVAASSVTGTSAVILASVTTISTGDVIYSGSSVVTLASVTTAAAGETIYSGSSAVTLGSVTTVAAGDVIYTGTSTNTLGSATTTASGDVIYLGTSAVTSASVTTAASGTVTTLTISGTSTVALPSVTTVSVGDVLYTGTATVTLASVAMASSGTVTDTSITGTSALTLPNITTVSTGDVIYSGTSVLTVPSVTTAAAGETIYAGTSVLTLSSITAAATGSVSVDGTSAVTLGSVTTAATGTVTSQSISGSSTVTLASVTAAASGLASVEGTSTITLGSVTTTAAGETIYTGTSALVLGSVTIAAAGQVIHSGASAVTLGGITSAATGEILVIGTSNVTVAATTTSSSGLILITGTSTVTLGAAQSAAAGARTNVATTGTSTITLAATQTAAVGTRVNAPVFGTSTVTVVMPIVFGTDIAQETDAVTQVIIMM